MDVFADLNILKRADCDHHAASVNFTVHKFVRSIAAALWLLQPLVGLLIG